MQQRMIVPNAVRVAVSILLGVLLQNNQKTKRNPLPNLMLWSVVTQVVVKTVPCHHLKKVDEYEAISCRTISGSSQQPLPDYQQASICSGRKQQEGQHPLTGQCAANFRLLANQ